MEKRPVLIRPDMTSIGYGEYSDDDHCFKLVRRSRIGYYFSVDAVPLKIGLKAEDDTLSIIDSPFNGPITNRMLVIVRAVLEKFKTLSIENRWSRVGIMETIRALLPMMEELLVDYESKNIPEPKKIMVFRKGTIDKSMFDDIPSIEYYSVELDVLASSHEDDEALIYLLTSTPPGYVYDLKANDFYIAP